MKMPNYALRHENNRLASKAAPFDGRAEEILGAAAFADAMREITAWPDYAPTPLIPLAGLAEALGLGAVRGGAGVSGAVEDHTFLFQIIN